VVPNKKNKQKKRERKNYISYIAKNSCVIDSIIKTNKQ